MTLLNAVRNFVGTLLIFAALHVVTEERLNEWAESMVKAAERGAS
jgi:hypothetical protein